MKKGSTGNGIVDDDALHVLLQRRAVPDGLLEINQRQLARELLLTIPTMNRVILRMIDDERLIPITRQAHQPGVFEVVDARKWAAEHRD